MNLTFLSTIYWIVIKRWFRLKAKWKKIRYCQFAMVSMSSLSIQLSKINLMLKKAIELLMGIEHISIWKKKNPRFKIVHQIYTFVNLHLSIYQIPLFVYLLFYLSYLPMRICVFFFHFIFDIWFPQNKMKLYENLAFGCPCMLPHIWYFFSRFFYSYSLRTVFFRFIY